MDELEAKYRAGRDRHERLCTEVEFAIEAGLRRDGIEAHTVTGRVKTPESIFSRRSNGGATRRRSTRCPTWSACWYVRALPLRRKVAELVIDDVRLVERTLQRATEAVDATNRSTNHSA